MQCYNRVHIPSEPIVEAELEASLEGSDKARATRRLDCKGMYAAPPERG